MKNAFKSRSNLNACSPLEYWKLHCFLWDISNVVFHSCNGLTCGVSFLFAVLVHSFLLPSLFETVNWTSQNQLVIILNFFNTKQNDRFWWKFSIPKVTFPLSNSIDYFEERVTWRPNVAAVNDKNVFFGHVTKHIDSPL